MNNIPELLGEFQSISLAEMDKVKLLDRADTKYVFAEEELPRLLEVLKNDYFVLEEAGSRTTGYETLYFDTENFDFYFHHHNQKLNRFKARFRRYVESNHVFFEVKFKSNKDRTTKERIRNNEINMSVTGKEKDLFESITKLKAEHLIPRLWVFYKRITLVGKSLGERLTLDMNLSFKEGIGNGNERTKTMERLVIAEVKQKKVSYSSPFIRLMAKQHRRQLSISKYCIGISLLHPRLKMNNFKEKLLTINKIVYGLH